MALYFINDLKQKMIKIKTTTIKCKLNSIQQFTVYSDSTVVETLYFLQHVQARRLLSNTVKKITYLSEKAIESIPQGALRHWCAEKV